MEMMSIVVVDENWVDIQSKAAADSTTLQVERQLTYASFVYSRLEAKCGDSPNGSCHFADQ
jgi:hypothetical protein